MCLMAWKWQPGSATPLVLIANRDEFYARPTLPLHWWAKTGEAENGTQILAGKDLQQGGTWLGVSRNGRLAALTNYRAPDMQREDAPSRGTLVANFLQSNGSAADYLQQLLPHTQDYNPFNLLVFDGLALMGLESRRRKVLHLPEGMGALSNADFQTPWPKLVALQQRLQAQLESASAVDDHPQLLALLHDRTLAPDASLPETGVPLALERVLSAIFVAAPGYGTRACSSIRVHQTHIEFFEQSFNASGLTGSVKEVFAYA
ncbi:MAG: NRDE family protein [Rhodoferax sp.]|nr:NRDE family protein [Rhodoferax sp.]